MSVISSRQIRYTRWYLSHRGKIKKTIYGILIFLIILWWSIFGYNLYVYIKGTDLYQENLKELINDRIDYVKLHHYFKPKDVFVEDNIALNTGENIYDFITKIVNPNENWRISSLKYKFIWNQNETKIKETFLMPASNSFATAFRQEVNNLDNLDFVIENIDWERIRKNDLKKLQILSKIKITNPNVEFVVPQEKMISLPKVSFTIKNESIYGFWEIACLVILFDNDNIVGVSKIPVKELRSEEEKTISFMWSNIPSAHSIQVIPLLNVFDEEAYIPVK